MFRWNKGALDKYFIAVNNTFNERYGILVHILNEWCCPSNKFPRNLINTGTPYSLSIRVYLAGALFHYYSSLSLSVSLFLSEEGELVARHRPNVKLREPLALSPTDQMWWDRSSSAINCHVLALEFL